MDDVRSRHRMLAVLARRAAEASRPGERSDGHRVVLAIEGGGMRGTVSAGMALAIQQLGLLPLFDAVYGASAGAISGAWLLSARPEGLRGWTDPVFAKALIRRGNVLRARPVVDVRGLIETVYVRDFPLDFASVLAAPIEFHPLATDVLTGEAVDLYPTLTCERDLQLALRASAALRMLAARPWPSATGCCTTRAWPSRSRSARRCATAPATCSCCVPAAWSTGPPRVRRLPGGAARHRCRPAPPHPGAADGVPVARRPAGRRRPPPGRARPRRPFPERRPGGAVHPAAGHLARHRPPGERRGGAARRLRGGSRRRHGGAEGRPRPLKLEQFFRKMFCHGLCDGGDGGNRGIGHAVCERLAGDGHRVLLVARDPERGRRAAASIRGTWSSWRAT
ncbi:patatin-like phospholipase family protein [Nonomuraea thailandensis]